jgi:hypothetical protein
MLKISACGLLARTQWVLGNGAQVARLLKAKMAKRFSPKSQKAIF